MAFFGGYGAHVVEDFAAGAAGAGVAHGPEIVFQAGDGDDAVGWNILVEPNLPGVFINAKDCAWSHLRATENGDIQFVFGNVEPLGRSDQLPRIGDGFLLEVIAEGEIAHHLEESMVALGEADVFEVVVFAAGADAFLGGGGLL